MDEVVTARLALSAARAAHESALRGLRTAEMGTALFRLPDGTLDESFDHDLNPDLFARLEAAKAALANAQAVEADARTTYDGAVARHSELAVQDPLFPTDNVDPVLLLPVRIEAVYGVDRAGAPVLRIRVYPDDVHVDTHEPELTERERGAGMAYWRALGSAGDDAHLRASAWETLVGAAGGDRATWIRTALIPNGGTPAEPTFPDTASRPEAWTRAAQTLLLPDAFEFTAYRDGGLVWRHRGADIPDTLPVGVSPDGEGEAAPDGAPLDPASRWLVHYETAVQVGMALTVPLADPAERFDLLTAVGVSGQDAETGATRVESALAAHAYTGGIAFLPVGTPSNNTPAARSAWRSRGMPTDPDTTTARQTAYDATGPQDAPRTARALGIDGRPVLAPAADDPGADDAVLVEALHRLQADNFGRSRIWRKLDDINDTSDPEPPPWYADAAAHYTAHVRARGPLPTLRIGRQPYGLLPVSSMDLWVADEPAAGLAEHVRSVDATLSAHVDRVTRIGEGADQDAVLLDLLSRRGLPQRIGEWFPTFKEKGDPPQAAAGSIPSDLAVAWQWPEARVDDVGLPREPDWDEPFPAELAPELRTFLDTRPLTELLALFDESIQQMINTGVAPIPDDFTAVYEPIARTMWQVQNRPTTSMFYKSAENLYNWIRNLIASGPTLPDDVQRAAASAQRLRHGFTGYVDLEDEAVAHLDTVERIYRETYGPLAHRIDAWTTSLASRRLSELRAARPRGVRTGGYGWLTDVEPADPNPTREGYVMSPSLHHATTAAVLRSGWQAHTDRTAFAVDLQSSRVRRAQAMIEGVREGQSVAALLGYQFERALHDAKLDKYIAGFRRAYPLAPLVQPDADDHATARVAIGARNVADGQALRKDLARLSADPAQLAAAAGQEVGGDGSRLLRLIGELEETFDATSDLLLAESVHQLVGGSPLRAGIAADAAGRGHDLPAEYDVARTPRSGLAITHHLAVLLPGALPAGWADDRPLAQLEPGVEAWLRHRLGTAARWGADALGGCALDAVTALPDNLRTALTTAGAPADQVSDLLLLLDRLRAALAAATPLGADQLGSQDAGRAAAYDLSELDGRVRPWLGRVRAAAARLTGLSDPADPVVDELAALGIPVGLRGTGDLLDRLRAHLSGAALDDPPAPPTPTADPLGADAWLGSVLATTERLLHPAVRVTPRLAQPLPPPPKPVPGPDEIDDWVRDMTLVRPRVRAWDDALVMAELIAGTSPAAYDVRQALGGQGTPLAWLATGTTPGDPTSKSSLVLQFDDAAGAQALIVDSWTEIAPHPPGPNGAEEVLGIAFDYDRPGARAPQALLIAVPPDPARGWCRDDLHACVEETLLRARTRTLDLVDVPELMTLLPIPEM